MKKHEKEIEQVLLNNEKDVYKRLEGTYNQALKDAQGKYKELQESIDKLIEKESRYTNDPEQLEIIKSQIQSKIYQQNYQKVLQEQLNNALDTLNSSTVNSIEDYLNTMYEDGFISQLYSLQKYGIPVLAPINHELLVKAVSYNTDNIPLSKRIYSNVEKAKRQIRDEISRGIATGMSQQDIARNISERMGVSYRKAKQIAQNEGHRVVNDAKIDSMHASKDRGADIVKVWDCTFDKKTRPIHAQLDQQHAEIDDYFEYSGGKVFAPKRFGKASLDINCRCALMSVPRWDIEDEVEKRDNITGELIKAKNYADWKEKYYNAIEKHNSTQRKVYNNDIRKLLDKTKVEYRPCEAYTVQPTIDEIIEKVGGGDLTEGSCASLSYAFAGQRAGLNVLDFRGGQSEYVFSLQSTSFKISDFDGVKKQVYEDYNAFKCATSLLKDIELNKEYILAVGQHAAIVKKTKEGYFYLELQTPNNNGFHKMNTFVLKHRFGCKKSFTRNYTKYKHTGILIDVESLGKSDEFKDLLGYINTDVEKQKKGVSGYAK